MFGEVSSVAVDSRDHIWITAEIGRGRRAQKLVRKDR